MEVAKQRCCADAACEGFSYFTSSQRGKPPGFGCLKANADCGSKHQAGVDGYTIVGRAGKPVPPSGPGATGGALNISFDFRAVGFAPDTLVRVRDLFAQRDLGVFTAQYTSPAVPLHGAHMLRLEYEPRYHTDL